MPEQVRSAERPSEPQANGLTDLLGSSSVRTIKLRQILLRLRVAQFRSFRKQAVRHSSIQCNASTMVVQKRQLIFQTPVAMIIFNFRVRGQDLICFFVLAPFVEATA